MELTALPGPVMSSADMLSGISGDIFADIPADPGVDASSEDTSSDGDSGDDGVIDIPEPAAADTGADETVIEEPADEEEAVAAEPADEKTETKEPTEEDLPEGVRKGRDRKGKDGYFLEENRYKSIYGNHQLVQSAAEILGEPLTAEAIKLRNDAYLGNERLFSNLTSGDVKNQTDVVNYILNEMSEAQKNGEVGVDPAIPFAESVYTSLKENAPDGYANLRLAGARDLIAEIFQAGAARATADGDLSLFSTAQHLAITIANVGPKPANMTPEQYVELCYDRCAQMGLDFHTKDDIPQLFKAEDPSAALARENAALKAQLNGRSETGTAEQFDTWRKGSFQNISKALFDDAVTPALASVADGWKKFPDDYKRLVTDPLHRDVVAEVKADPALKERAAEIIAKAKRATSEQVRSRYGDELKQLYIHRAKQAAAKLAPPITEFAANTLKGLSDATHERRSGAQTRTAPKGPSAPVKQSLVPALAGFKNGVFDHSTAVKQAMQLIGGR